MDPELDKILSKMKEEKIKEYETSQTKKDKAPLYGEYREIVEEEFLPFITKAELAVCHFYHSDFERCKIVDKHLKIIAEENPSTSVVKINSEKAPFFVTKLAIKVLPTICLFKQGILLEKIVGFGEFGGIDDFKTDAMRLK